MYSPQTQNSTNADDKNQDSLNSTVRAALKSIENRLKDSKTSSHGLEDLINHLGAVGALITYKVSSSEKKEISEENLKIASRLSLANLTKITAHLSDQNKTDLISPEGIGRALNAIEGLVALHENNTSPEKVSGVPYSNSARIERAYSYLMLSGAAKSFVGDRSAADTALKLALKEISLTKDLSKEKQLLTFREGIGALEKGVTLLQSPSHSALAGVINDTGLGEYLSSAVRNLSRELGIDPSRSAQSFANLAFRTAINRSNNDAISDRGLTLLNETLEELGKRSDWENVPKLELENRIKGLQATLGSYPEKNK